MATYIGSHLFLPFAIVQGRGISAAHHQFISCYLLCSRKTPIINCYVDEDEGNNYVQSFLETNVVYTANSQ